jgi:glycine/D-amino acid oxidase-like deaminating enzyme
MLLEADGLGLGATACGSGLVTHRPRTEFLALERARGRRDARQIWEMTRRAALDLAATARRLGLKCQLEMSDAIHVATREDQVFPLRRELRARRSAGLEGVWLSAERVRQATNIAASGGLRTRGQSQLDPYRLCLGLAAAADKRGAIIHERTRVSRIRTGPGGVDVTTDAGRVRSQRVIVTTGSPTTLFRPLARHVRDTQTYMVLTPPLGAKIRKELGQRDTVLSDRDDPAHYLRWTRDNRMLFGGGDQPQPARRGEDKVLVQRTGQLMYELSTLYPVVSGIRPELAWAAPIKTTSDGVLIAGPHRQFPRHLFVFGTGHGGIAGSFLASRLLLRHHLGKPGKGDELFGFTR